MDETSLYSENEISAKIRKLNACYQPDFQWQDRRAQKDHIDLFDKKINEGEHYFRLSMGGHYSNDLKLSKNSMERFLFAVFTPGPGWEDHAKKIINKRMEKARAIINSLRS